MRSAQKPVKQVTFYVIAILLPFILLLLLELCLRLFNYGQSFPLFVPAKQFEGYLQANPNIIQRYFPANVTPPAVAPDTFLFKAQKPDNTLRIVTMGGSTMAGFPYGRFASVAGMLKQRLKASNPEQNIEIISVAMSSINTYTLLDTVDEVIDIQPDAVLIYTGHNEYLGVMGVGSVYASKGGHAANLVFLLVKDWRIYQLVQNLYYAVNGQTVQHHQANAPASQPRTVMANVAKNKHIVYQDAIFEAGRNQFEQNLSSILEKLSTHKVPVFISNLVANESDQAPFESVANKTLDSAVTKMRTAQFPINEKDLGLAHQYKHANYMYALAQQYTKANDHKNAQAFYTKAKDYDLLRFRAPTVFNDIIETLAHSNKAKLVDTHAYMRAFSTHGSIGNDLMLEHLHPNHRGYFLLAESFYKALIEEALISPQYDFQQEQAWLMSPITSADEIFADYKIARLMSDYPFRKTPVSVALPQVNSALDSIAVDRIQGKGWLAMQQDLLSYYQQQMNANTPNTAQSRQYLERAANSAGLVFDALPNKAQNARAASILYLRANILPMAKYYAIQAVKLAPENVNYTLTLAEIYYKLEDLDASLLLLNKALDIEPNHQRALQIKAHVSKQLKAHTNE